MGLDYVSNDLAFFDLRTITEMGILKCLGGLSLTFFFQILPLGALFKSQLLLILLAFATDLSCTYEHFYSIHAKDFSLRRKIRFSVKSSCN